MMQKKSTHAFGTIHFYRYHQIPCLVCLVSHSSKPCVGLANFEQQSVGSLFAQAVRRSGLTWPSPGERLPIQKKLDLKRVVIEKTQHFFETFMIEKRFGF